MKNYWLALLCGLVISIGAYACGDDEEDPCDSVCQNYVDLCTGSDTSDAQGATPDELRSGCMQGCASSSEEQRSCVTNATSCSAANACVSAMMSMPTNSDNGG